MLFIIFIDLSQCTPEYILSKTQRKRKTLQFLKKKLEFKLSDT